MKSLNPVLAGITLALMLSPGATPADTPAKLSPSPAAPVRLTTQGDNMKPCVTLRPSGGVYVSWEQRKDDGTAILFARSKDGLHVDAPVQVSLPTMQLDLGAEAGPNVAIDSKGVIYVAWAAVPNSSRPSVAPVTVKPTTGAASARTQGHLHPDAAHADGAHPGTDHSAAGHSGGSSGGSSGGTGAGSGGKHYGQPTDIWVARSTDDGKSFSKPVQVNDDPAGTVHRFPFMNVDAQGGICVSWLDKRKKSAEGADLTRVFFARSTDGAQTFGKNVDATSGQPDPICHCCRVAQTIDPHLGLLIAFRNDIHDRRDMFLVRATDGGHDFTAPLALEETNWKIPFCPMDGPSIATDPSGTLHAVWMTGGKVEAKPLVGEVPPDSYKVLYSRIPSSAGRASMGSPETPILLGAGHHPRLALGDNGETFVAWREKAIVLARITQGSKGGHPTVQVIKYASEKDQPGYPALVVSRDQMIYCAWQQSISDDSKQIYLCRVPVSQFDKTSAAQISRSH